MKIFIKILISSALLFNACSMTDVLDQEPPHALPSDQAIVDLQTAENAMIGAFAQLPEAHIEFMGAYMTGLMRAGSTGNGFITNEVSTEHNTVSNFWSRLYRVVSASNGILEQLPALEIEDEARKDQILGTAHFLRAYANFELLRYFSRYDEHDHANGIILREKLVRLSDYEKSRSSVADSYTFIENDLVEALELVPVVAPRHYVNRTAVQALLSRFYLYRGYSKQDDITDLRKAIDYADQVITERASYLEPTFQQVFKRGLASPELIWGRFPDKTTKMKYNNYLVSPSPFVMSGPKLDSMLTGDPRRTQIVGSNPVYRTRAIIKYYVTNQEIEETLYLLRMPEQYLIKAEAMWRAGDDLEECKAVLDQLLSRMNIASKATDRVAFGRELFHNWAIELFLENGHEWFAAQRFDQLEALQGLTNKNRYIFPIPRKEIDLNALAAQNDGY